MSLDVLGLEPDILYGATIPFRRAWVAGLTGAGDLSARLF
jgi:hypothetical protein